MNVNSFYVLKERLYVLASAGCAVLSEDFRFKRAVEEFEPLSKSNSAFKKLYDMCAGMFKSENPAPVLSDCLALADALAVTQGVFSDNSNAKSAELNIKSPYSAPYSALEKLYKNLKKSSVTLLKLPYEYKAYLSDPRVINLFLYYMENGSDNNNFAVFAEIMYEVCGDKLIKPLKESLGKSGRQVKYIAKFRGETENDWYVSLALDENNSPEIRTEAVKALVLSEKNAEVLIQLYRMEKGKIKNAALMSLAELGSKEAEPIFKKLCEAGGSNNRKYITASSGEKCADYAAAAVKDALLSFRSKKTESKSEEEATMFVRDLLFNKTSAAADEAYMSLRNTEPERVNGILIAGLNGANSKKVALQVDRLYSKDKRFFFKAKLLREIIRGDYSLIKSKSGNNNNYIINNILFVRYFPLAGKYYNDYIIDERYPASGRYCYGGFFMGERYPEEILDYFLSSTDIMLNSLETVENKAMFFIKRGKNGPGASFNKLPVTLFRQTYACVHKVMMILSELMKCCAPEDKEKIRSVALKIALRGIEICSEYLSADLVREYYKEIPERDTLRIYKAFIINALLYQDPLWSYSHYVEYADYVLKPLSAESRYSALKAWLEELKFIEGYVEKDVFNGVTSLLQSKIDGLSESEGK